MWRNKIATLGLSPVAAILVTGCLTSTPSQKGPITEYTRNVDWSGWQMNLLSLNVWGVPVISKDIPERMDLIGRAILNRKVDFAFIQEAWTEKEFNTLKDKSKFKYGQHFPDPRSMGSGLAMLTSSPIKRDAFNVFYLSGQLSHVDDGEALADKGVASVTVNHKGLPLTMINTHTVARNGNDEDGPNERYLVDRYIQLFQIFAQIIEQADSDAFVVAGDYNMRVIHSDYDFWLKLSSLEANFVEPQNPTFCTSCAEDYYSDGRSHGQIDYIFLSPRLSFNSYQLDFDKPVEVKGKMANYSDHYGWVADIRVDPTKVKPTPEKVRQNITESLAQVEQIATDFINKDEVQPAGIEDKICRTCEAKDAREKIRLYEEAMSSPKPSKEALQLRTRLESYIQIFR